MNNMYKIFKEQWMHRKLIYKLAIYNTKSKYANHLLGVFWDIIQPALQVAIYYVVFGLGLRGTRADVDGVPFIIYLIGGIFPWLFITASVNNASNAIQSQLDLVTKMKFPSSTLLTIAFVNSLFSFIITSVIMIIISLTFGYSEPMHFLALLYVIIASYLLVMGIALIMSTLIIIIRDMKNILQNIMRMFFFLTPIFWSVSESNQILHLLTSLNPFAYIVMNYRYAMVFEDTPLYGDFGDHLYFWSVTLLLLFIGVSIHFRFRHKLVDYR